MFSSKCRKSYPSSSRVWVGLSSVRWDETIMLILYDNSYHYWEHGFVRVRETRQSCSSLALPHKPTRPDNPDPIWRAGSWFSLLEVIVITVRGGTGSITARRCSYYTFIFTVQLRTVQLYILYTLRGIHLYLTEAGLRSSRPEMEPVALFLGQSFCQGADNEWGHQIGFNLFTS